MDSSLLFYPKTDEIFRIEVDRREKMNLLIQRNKVAFYYHNPLLLPKIISNDHACSTCFQKEICWFYSKVRD